MKESIKVAFVFINGALATLYTVLISHSNYEDKIFTSLASIVACGSPNEDSVIIRAKEYTHNLIYNRAILGDGKLKDELQSLSGDLLTAQGACGSYSKVFARIMTELGYEVRIALMRAGDTACAHVMAEVKTCYGWAVVDPLYNMVYVRPDGKLADFKEVQKNWAYYLNQLPPNYDMKYDYEGVSYTNWNKIPVIMPAVKKVLDLSIGKNNADHISLKAKTLNVFKMYAVLVLITIAVISVIVIYFHEKRNRAFYWRDYKKGKE